MKIIFLLSLINLLFCFDSNAQLFEWIKAKDSDNVASLNLLKIDADGNVYRGGTTNEGIYLIKYNEDGTEVWEQSIEGNIALMGLALDNENNILLTGRFGAIIDFDPGVGTFEMTPESVQDIFILKLDNTGNFLWTKGIGGIEESWNMGVDITADAANNIVAMGSFRGEIDFDPGPGTYYLGDSDTTLFDDYYMLKLTEIGDFIWARAIETDGLIDCYDVETDESGNVYTLGVTQEFEDFDPGPDEFEFGVDGSSAVGFIHKLNSDGDFVWVKGSQGLSYVRLYSLRIADDHIYSCGYFQGVTDLDPNDGEYLVGELGGGLDGFIQKWTLDGEFVWGAVLNSSYSAKVHDIDVDLDGNVYGIGSFRADLDLDPGASVMTVTGNSLEQIFISKLTSEGEFIWGQAYGADAADRGYEIRADAMQNILAYGLYRDEYDFDLSAGEAILNCDEIKCSYLMKLNDCDLFYKTDTIVSCEPYTWVNGITYTTSVNAGYVKVNETGCDSILKLVYINHSKEFVTEIHTCEPYTWIEDGETYYVDTTVSVFYTGIEGCDSLETLELKFDHVSSIQIMDTCLSIVWIDGVTYENDTIVEYLTTTVDGCDSLVTLILLVNPPTSFQNVEICKYISYTWTDGITYYGDTIVSQIYVTESGCDSIVTLNLSVVDIITTVSVTPLTLKADMYGEGETHQWLDCNDGFAPIPGETEFYFYPEINGNYAVEITKDGCKDTSACYAITLLSVEEFESEAVSIYPNPSSGQFNLQFQRLNEVELTIRDLDGKLVYQTHLIDQPNFDFTLNQTAGIYILELKLGEERQYYKLVKL